MDNLSDWYVDHKQAGQPDHGLKLQVVFNIDHKKAWAEFKQTWGITPKQAFNRRKVNSYFDQKGNYIERAI